MTLWTVVKFAIVVKIGQNPLYKVNIYDQKKTSFLMLIIVRLIDKSKALGQIL